MFPCESTKFDRIYFLYNNSEWLALSTRASGKKVTNYLFDHAEYENNLD